MLFDLTESRDSLFCTGRYTNLCCTAELNTPHTTEFLMFSFRYIFVLEKKTVLVAMKDIGTYHIGTYIRR